MRHISYFRHILMYINSIYLFSPIAADHINDQKMLPLISSHDRFTTITYRHSTTRSESSRKAKQLMLLNGTWIARAPYGYKHITYLDGRKGIIQDQEAVTYIQLAYRLYATGNYSHESLKNFLASEYNIYWSTSFIDKILSNHFYYGIMFVKGAIHNHYYGSIISKELFDRVQVVKKRFNKKPFIYANLPFLYRGLIHCDTCGLSITAERHKGHIYYHCTQNKGAHNAPWVRQEVISKSLSDAFIETNSIQCVIRYIMLLRYFIRDINEQQAKYENFEKIIINLNMKTESLQLKFKKTLIKLLFEKIILCDNKCITLTLRKPFDSFIVR